MGNKKVPMQKRSDIPYAQRVSLMQRAAVDAHRQDAAMVGAKIALVALNDCFGIGFTRGVKFAKRYMELDRAFYRERDVEEIHLDNRLREIGFVVSPEGKIYGVKNEESGDYLDWKELRKMGAAAEVEEAVSHGK